MNASALEAANQGFSFVCNKFDAQDTRMASIEYVFYLSKVRPRRVDGVDGVARVAVSR